VAPFTSTMKRPRGIAILTGVLAIDGILFLLGAGALLLADQFGIYRGMIALVGVPHDAQMSTGLAALAGGVVQIGLAIGFFRLWRWAWGLGVLATGANVGYDALAIHDGVVLSRDQLITLIAAALILIYLLAPGVIRAFFHQPSSAAVVVKY
jgi:hypothetical protein